jgi:pimeloyl-ACP methyl ester carboxylesterase
MAKRAMRDVVVVLPGITGSVLQKDGKDVWNVTGGSVLRALLSLGQNVKDLALTEDPPDVDDLGDGVTASKVMRDIHLIPGLWKIDGYSKTLKYVTDTFDVVPGENFFEFPYDWRRDNRVAARKLAKDAQGWLAAWREKSGAADAKLILVGHSMGGIVSRYYLECLDGWRDTRVLVTFGTPYSGSLNSVGTLVNGLKKKIGPVGIDLSGLVRSLTAVYQLLPTYACYDGGDGKLVGVSEATIPHVDQQKAKAAAEFHDEIRNAVKAHEQEDEYRENRYDIRPVVGILQPTFQSARAAGDGVQLIRTYDGEDQGGDGTVPRISATPVELEREANAMFASERHASLQNEDGVLVQLRGVMSGLDIDFPGFRDAFPTIGLGLELDDAYQTDEPVPVRVHPEEEPA